MMDTTPRVYSYVRFSTPQQEEGDSTRRQEEARDRYLNERGLTLDNSLIDKGLSAFHGTHRTKGALGAFLRLVEQGQIPKGSILIVENLDRLSREEPMDALNQFDTIIRAGIKVVTLQGGFPIEHDRESMNNNPAQLFGTVGDIYRANQEVKRKSEMQSATWENKRDQARKNGDKLTSIVPSWIKAVKLSDGKIKYDLIRERAEAVELIFHKKLAGKGSEKIARELNQDPHIWKPEKSKRNKTGGWRISYVNKILSNRAVIGEGQPHIMVTIEDEKGNKKKVRQPDGDPIKDYYPKAIDDDLFYQVQKHLQDRERMNGRGGGLPGKGNNLFTHVVKCGICGSPMHYIGKGKGPKGGQYLHCDSARRKVKVPIPIKMDKKFRDHVVAIRLIGSRMLNRPKGEELPKRETKEDVCPAKLIRYDEFEKLFFKNLEDIEIRQLIPNEDKTTARIKELDGKLIANGQRIKELERKITNLSDTISDEDDPRVQQNLKRKMTECEDEKECLIAENKQAEQEIKGLRELEDDLKQKIGTAIEVYSYLESARDENERIERRLKLRNEIQKTFEWIKIYPLQEPYKEIEEVEPGTMKHMKSKFMDKIRMKFKGTGASEWSAVFF